VGISTDGSAGDSNIAGADTKEIVSGWAKEFKIEGLWGNGETGNEDEMVVE
jgi:nuclear GTP-binding protein